MRRSPLAAFAGVFVVTLLSLVAVGAVLPVLPHYVRGPLGSGNFAVGLVIGAFAFTALACRPLAGHFADLRGRRPVVVVGSLLAAAAGLLYFVPAGLPGLLLARLVLGAGEGMVFTAGATWVVDLAPPDRRGRGVGRYGPAAWCALRPRRRRLHRAGGHGGGHAARRGRSPRSDRATSVRRCRRRNRGRRPRVDRAGDEPPSRPRGSGRDGRRVRPDLPIAVAGGGQQRPRVAPGRGARNVH